MAEGLIGRQSQQLTRSLGSGQLRSGQAAAAATTLCSRSVERRWRYERFVCIRGRL